MTARVGIVGIGQIKFGNLSEYDLVDIMAYTATDALIDAGILEDRRIIDQTGIASALVSRLDLEPTAAELVENGPASGASAVKLGYMAIASGMANVVMVVGGETMRKVTGWEATDCVATLGHPEAEYDMGLT